jgi:hypothetical protein
LRLVKGIRFSRYVSTDLIIEGGRILDVNRNEITLQGEVPSRFFVVPRSVGYFEFDMAVTRPRNPILGI